MVTKIALNVRNYLYIISYTISSNLYKIYTLNNIYFRAIIFYINRKHILFKYSNITL